MRRQAAAALAFLAATSAAGAHQLIPGVTGVPGAALHTLTAADQVMALVAAGLLSGSGGWRAWLAGLSGLAFGFLGGFADMLLGPAIPFAGWRRWRWRSSSRSPPPSTSGPVLRRRSWWRP